MKLERYSVCIRAGETDRAAEIAAAIDGITDTKLRRILTMRYLNGWTWTKIGYVFGLGEAAVRLYAARHCQSYGFDL